MEFPECKFAKTNSIKEQWLHVRSEAMEVQVAIVELREATTDEERWCKAIRVIEELTDLQHSAQTLKLVIKREYPGLEFGPIEQAVIYKNAMRGYYE